MPSPLVTVVRQVIRYLMTLDRVEARESAVSLLEANWMHFAQTSPLTENLRPWQLLASDFAVALEPIDPAAASHVRAIADGIRARIMKVEPVSAR